MFVYRRHCAVDLFETRSGGWLFEVLACSNIQAARKLTLCVTKPHFVLKMMFVLTSGCCSSSACAVRTP